VRVRFCRGGGRRQRTPREGTRTLWRIRSGRRLTALKKKRKKKSWPFRKSRETYGQYAKRGGKIAVRPQGGNVRLNLDGAFQKDTAGEKKRKHVHSLPKEEEGLRNLQPKRGRDKHISFQCSRSEHGGEGRSPLSGQGIGAGIYIGGFGPTRGFLLCKTKGKKRSEKYPTDGGTRAFDAPPEEEKGRSHKKGSARTAEERRNLEEAAKGA